LSYKHLFRFYQKKKVAKVKINVAKTKPKNLTHPSLVKMSYRYLGTPPRIKIKKEREATNLIVKVKENPVEYG
jgi:hypothetical protein